ncbi:MAG TPA: hypothetical protein ENG56_00525 [Candidatus Aenigmarchaeota archaeon]|nr:hypothetical protein [Candidatus Aenigmarchaeota archaeon]
MIPAKFVSDLAKEMNLKISKGAKDVIIDALEEIALEISFLACLKAKDEGVKTLRREHMESAIKEFYR